MKSYLAKEINSEFIPLFKLLYLVQNSSDYLRFYFQNYLQQSPLQFLQPCLKSSKLKISKGFRSYHSQKMQIGGLHITEGLETKGKQSLFRKKNINTQYFVCNNFVVKTSFLVSPTVTLSLLQRSDIFVQTFRKSYMISIGLFFPKQMI